MGHRRTAPIPGRQYWAHDLQADEPVPERHRNECPDQYVRLLGLFRDVVELHLQRRGDVTRPASWVIYLDVVSNLASEGPQDDQVTTFGWRYNQDNPLKDATKIFRNKNSHFAGMTAPGCRSYRSTPRRNQAEPSFSLWVNIHG